MTAGKRQTRGRRQKASASVIASAERRSEALAFRKQGYTFDEIGEAMGITRQSAHSLVMGAISDLVTEPAEELRQLELSRLDAMLTGIWGDALKGDVRAIDAVLKIQDRRARFIGLDAPQKVAGPDGGPITHKVVVDAVFAELVGALDHAAAGKSGGAGGPGKVDQAGPT